MHKNKDQDVFLKASLLPSRLCLLSDYLASSSCLVVTQGGQQDMMESVCADTILILDCVFFFFLSKGGKIYTDGQRELCVGLQM